MSTATDGCLRTEKNWTLQIRSAKKQNKKETLTQKEIIKNRKRKKEKGKKAALTIYLFLGGSDDSSRWLEMVRRKYQNIRTSMEIDFPFTSRLWHRLPVRRQRRYYYYCTDFPLAPSTHRRLALWPSTRNYNQ